MKKIYATKNFQILVKKYFVAGMTQSFVLAKRLIRYFAEIYLKIATIKMAHL